MGKATKKKMKEAEAKKPNYSSMLLQAKEKALKKEQGIKSFDPMTAIRGYENYALRPLNEFVPRTRSLNTTTRIRELIRYAFNKYDPPAFLYQVWDPEFNKDLIRVFPGFIREDYKRWYITIAQGKSLYKEHSMGLLTKKETHYFSTCPYPFTISQAIWYSVILGMGEYESPPLARKIASTKISQYPLTDFWKDTARWFMIHPCSIQQTNDLIDYIRTRHEANAEWYLKDVTLPNLIRHMNSWHREMNRVRSMSYRYCKWDGIPIQDSTIERGMGKSLIRWKFHQILTGKELAEEGNKQHHCVSSYGSMCHSGQCSIWSLTRWDVAGNGTHALTIEVRNNSIAQARGYANRMPRADEKSALNEWASKCGFQIRGL